MLGISKASREPEIQASSSVCLDPSALCCAGAEAEPLLFLRRTRLRADGASVTALRVNAHRCGGGNAAGDSVEHTLIQVFQGNLLQSEFFHLFHLVISSFVWTN